jgi:hypothetical protein
MARLTDFHRQQRPIYFVSEVLSDSKTRYSQMQKLVYAALMTKLKLRHYFDTHPTMVVSKYPLRKVIQNPEAEGRIAKWALELMGRTSRTPPAVPSSPMCWQTSLQSGPRSKFRRHQSSRRSGLCTSTTRS